jgi:hypothetical protein
MSSLYYSAYYFRFQSSTIATSSIPHSESNGWKIWLSLPSGKCEVTFYFIARLVVNSIQIFVMEFFELGN